MFVVYGIYQFRPRRLAFRNDYCLTCCQLRQSEQLRTFNAFHIFWIPIIPLGFWKQWLCTRCGSRPHYRRTTRRSLKWIGFAILALLFVVTWTVQPDPEALIWTWLVRVAAPLGVILTLVHLLHTPKDISLETQLAKIPPADDTICPFCRVPLVLIGSGPCCPSCGVVQA